MQFQKVVGKGVSLLLQLPFKTQSFKPRILEDSKLSGCTWKVELTKPITETQQLKAAPLDHRQRLSRLDD
jgi:hypothetical protein